MARFADNENFGPLHIGHSKWVMCHKAIFDPKVSLWLHFYGIHSFLLYLRQRRHERQVRYIAHIDFCLCFEPLRGPRGSNVLGTRRGAFLEVWYLRGFVPPVCNSPHDAKHRQGKPCNYYGDTAHDLYLIGQTELG
jgi:hypothetical protein